MLSSGTRYWSYTTSIRLPRCTEATHSRKSVRVAARVFVDSAGIARVSSPEAMPALTARTVPSDAPPRAVAGIVGVLVLGLQFGLVRTNDRRALTGSGANGMGFDIFIVRSRLRNETVERKDRFTGELLTVRPPEPLSAQELQTVRQVLKKAGTPAPDQHGFSPIRFADGGSAEFHDPTDIDEGCSVTLRSGLSPDCLRFLFDLLKAAEWVMFPAMEGNPAIVSSPGIAKEFPEFPEVVCRSPDELRTILAGGFAAWQPYRDRVARDRP